MQRSFILCLAVIAATLVCFAPQTTQVSSAKSDKFKRSARPVPGRYIVVLEDLAAGGATDYVDARINEVSSEYRGRVDKKFAHAIEGYSVEMTEAEARRVADDPRIKYVEEDGFIEPQEIQSNATWGISRIDQRNWQNPLSTDYEYSATGAGVNVYVLDTRVLRTHPDFEGRVADAFDAFNDQTPVSECNAHGTHVAGTIGSKTFGVAKRVTMYSVAVMPCSGAGTSTSVLAGLDWVSRNGVRPGVINMSFGSTTSSSLDSAVQRLIYAGFTAVAAAGNYNDDACSYSPAHIADVITVGATDNRDYRSGTSNFGPCVDVFAPGVNILSTWNSPTETVGALSGTSTAAPHVAGAAALYLETNWAALGRDVQAALVNNASQGVVFDFGNGSPNLLLYSNFGTSGDVPPQPPPPSPCGGTEFIGSIVSSGSSAYQTKTGFAARQGTISGTLDVPASSNFRLHLEKSSGSGRRAGFTLVASSPGGSSKEKIELKVKSGTYRWRIESVNGSGNYDLCSLVP